MLIRPTIRHQARTRAHSRHRELWRDHPNHHWPGGAGRDRTLRRNRSCAHQPRHDRCRRIGRSARLLMSNRLVSDLCRSSGDADSAGTEDLYDRAGDSPWPPGSGRGNRGLRSGWIPATHWLSPSVPVDTYQVYDGTDELGIVGTVAPGLFAQGGRCWAHPRPSCHVVVRFDLYSCSGT